MYRTPFKAVPPLIPYLRRDGVRTFAERCCGEGDLIRHVEFFGFTCVSRGDIATGQDALKLTVADLNNADAIITNLPFKYPDDPLHSRRLMHDLIRHFLDIRIPSWLLQPHDWLTNQNAAPFLPYCSDIVAIGRVRWFPGTSNDGMDNSVWCRFDARHRGGPILHNDRGKAQRRSRMLEPGVAS